MGGLVLPHEPQSLERYVRGLDQRLAKLERYGLKSEAFIAPTLAGAWVNFGGSYATAGYARDPLGFVWLRGVIKNGAVPLTVFTLPVGYRPALDEIFNGIEGTNGSCRIDVTQGGAVIVQTGNNAYISLSGIRFRVA
jgi:hypothetical protein